jgi:hypothetical protein
VFASVTMLGLELVSMMGLAAVVHAQHEDGQRGRKIWRLFYQASHSAAEIDKLI